jgi:hypothetical protein
MAPPRGEYGVSVKKGIKYDRLTDTTLWDTRYGFVLTFNGEIVACIGLEAWDDTLTVVQIHGLKGVKSALYPFAWDRMLLHTVVSCAELAGYSRVEVVPSIKNYWFRERRAERFAERYDRSARLLGFVQKGPEENHVLTFD